MEWMLGGVIQANRLHQSGVMWSVRSLQVSSIDYAAVFTPKESFWKRLDVFDWFEK